MATSKQFGCLFGGGTRGIGGPGSKVGWEDVCIIMDPSIPKVGSTDETYWFSSHPPLRINQSGGWQRDLLDRRLGIRNSKFGGPYTPSRVVKICYGMSRYVKVK